MTGNIASDDEDDEDVSLPALPHGTKNYMTPQCYRRMLDEREHLVRVERPEVANIVAWAASNGDRSENGDYQLDDVSLLSPFGMNSLDETFTIESIDGGKMVLRTEELRLYFRKL